MPRCTIRDLVAAASAVACLSAWRFRTRPVGREGGTGLEPDHNQQYCSEGLRAPILGVMERLVRLPKDPRPERRASVRFPLTLDVRYSVSHRRAPVETGSGQLIDLSSSGLRFAAQGPLRPGLRLDVAIDWPVLLDGRIQLQLIVTGLVVWSSGTESALRILRHDFRTRSVRLNATSPQESDGPSVAGLERSVAMQSVVHRDGVQAET